jgi:hypothetical protein
MSSIQRSVTTLLAIVGLSACGGGGGSGGSNTPPPQTDPSALAPGGVWTVKYVVASGSNAGATMQGKALITEKGDTFFAQINTANGCTLVGFGEVLDTTGPSDSGSTNDAVGTFSQGPSINTSCSFPDGSASASTALSGTLTPGSSLQVTDTTTTSKGMVLGPETNTWSYSAIYNEKPSFATIGGNYADRAYTLTVSSTGAIFEQQPDTGCVINGQASAVDPFHNAWSLSFTFASCTGALAVLNGQTAIGLGYYDDSVSPNQFVYGIHVTVNGQTAIQAGTLNKD